MENPGKGLKMLGNVVLRGLWNSLALCTVESCREKFSTGIQSTGGKVCVDCVERVFLFMVIHLSQLRGDTPPVTS